MQNTEKLSRKGSVWDWYQYHMWANRDQSGCPRMALIGKETAIFTMGSCFAQNVARYLSQRGLNAVAFPETVHFNIRSTLQDLKHMLVSPQYSAQDF